MLQNWLKPLSKSFADAAGQLPETAFGQHVIHFRKELPDLRKVRIAIIGVDDTASNAIRKSLYRYAFPFPNDSIADLGNIRKPEMVNLVPVLYELITGNITPVILSNRSDLARAQFLAYQEAKNVVNWTNIDEDFRCFDAADSVFEPRHPLLFHFSLIGAQSHLIHSQHQKIVEKNNFEVLRLGRSRSMPEEAEPILRDADLLSFHLGALKNSEAPGVVMPSPSGFFLEEACQLTRYAGMSDKLTSFGIYGFEPANDHMDQTANAAAQLVWYFLDGFFNRKGDYPVSTKGLTEYVVDLPTYNYHLTFWKSAATGRWWLQVPLDTKRKHQRHRLIPCSYQDYQSACRQDLPDRLFKAFKRF